MIVELFFVFIGIGFGSAFKTSFFLEAFAKCLVQIARFDTLWGMDSSKSVGIWS